MKCEFKIFESKTNAKQKCEKGIVLEEENFIEINKVSCLRIPGCITTQHTDQSNDIG